MCNLHETDHACSEKLVRDPAHHPMPWSKGETTVPLLSPQSAQFLPYSLLVNSKFNPSAKPPWPPKPKAATSVSTNEASSVGKRQ